MMTTQVNININQFRVSGHEVVGFETFRGFVDMLRFCGPVSIGYDGGDVFQLYLQSSHVEAIISRFESFGIVAHQTGGQA